MLRMFCVLGLNYRLCQSFDEQPPLCYIIFWCFQMSFFFNKKITFLCPSKVLTLSTFLCWSKFLFSCVCQSACLSVCLSVCLSLSLTPYDTNCLLVLLHLSQGPFVGRYVSHQHFLGPKDPLSVCVISSFSVVISFCPIVWRVHLILGKCTFVN